MNLIAANRALWNSIIDFMLPRLCAGCGERIHDHGNLICVSCSESIQPLLQPVCALCGCPDARIKSENKCTNCPPGKAWFTRARGVAAFSGIAQVVVSRLKYSQRMEYAAFIADALYPVYDEQFSASSIDLLLPVPLHRTKNRERGFNQSALIAREFGQLRDISVDEKSLVRIRPTPSQTRLKRRQRRENVSGAFQCSNPSAICGKRILLIDDVYTTGSTVNECAKVLVEAGASSVECLTYARAVLQ